MFGDERGLGATGRGTPTPVPNGTLSHRSPRYRRPVAPNPVTPVFEQEHAEIAEGATRNNPSVNSAAPVHTCANAPRRPPVHMPAVSGEHSFHSDFLLPNCSCSGTISGRIGGSNCLGAAGSGRFLLRSLTFEEMV